MSHTLTTRDTEPRAQASGHGHTTRPGPTQRDETGGFSTAPLFTYGRDMIHFPPVRGSLAASGKSHAEEKNGGCHQFTPRHGPRNKALSLKRIDWLYPIFRDLHFHHGLLGVLLLLFAICLPLPAGEAVAIEVERDRLTAADLARVIPEWKKLDGSQVIAYAPLPGVERRVSRRQLIRWADQHGLKLNIEDLPEAVLVARRMRKLRAEEALRTVTGAVSERYQLPLEQLRVRLHGFSETLVPAGKLNFEIRGSLRRLNQPVPITLSWRDSDGRSGTVPLRASVSILGAYAVASQAIPAKSIVGPQDFIFREGILPGPPEKHLVSPKDVEGKTLQYSLKSGQALSRAMLLDTPLVQRGTLLSSRGNRKVSDCGCLPGLRSPAAWATASLAGTSNPGAGWLRRSSIRNAPR